MLAVGMDKDSQKSETFYFVDTGEAFAKVFVIFDLVFPAYKEFIYLGERGS